MWPSVRPSLFLCPALQLYSLSFLYLFMTVRFPGSLPRVYNISGCALHKHLPLNERSYVVYNVDDQQRSDDDVYQRNDAWSDNPT
jgi:hypothetical protein